MPTSGFGQEKRYEFEKGLMGSPFRLVFYAKNDSVADEAAHRAFGRIEQLNDLLSDYRDGSEINRLSATSGSGQWIAVSDDLFRILSISKKVSRRTGGTFDVTIGPVVQLWRRAIRRNEFPTEAELKVARRAVGYRFVKLRCRSQSVRLIRSGMRLDVGGIGKGYAADEAVKLLENLGITSVLIDAGGDITLAQPPPGRKAWEISVGSGDSTVSMPLAQAGVATSGATYRYLEHEGVRYSHIVDPETGVGLRFHVRTTVIAPNGTLADALATAVSVGGIRRSRKILRRFPGVQVWLLETEGGKTREWRTLE
ncbi:thiamine biosynthesis lipoprotein ApbE [Persicitalea jodogahamensis]|uniref:FAD:protein FMN transferase n=1 Tax=Persicitalea jodogahamensis TaxID=402147 RepID=A0A8J3G707_9BACT|nr:thiamine biosynthesis lipoprotein ApbE [Persicitalea jodogahamensis]